MLVQGEDQLIDQLKSRRHPFIILLVVSMNGAGLCARTATEGHHHKASSRFHFSTCERVVCFYSCPGVCSPVHERHILDGLKHQAR